MRNYRLPAMILGIDLEAHQQSLLNGLTAELLSTPPMAAPITAPNRKH